MFVHRANRDERGPGPSPAAAPDRRRASAARLGCWAGVGCSPAGAPPVGIRVGATPGTGSAALRLSWPGPWGRASQPGELRLPSRTRTRSQVQLGVLIRVRRVLTR